MNLEQAPWCTENWWVSHYNYAAEVRKNLDLPERVQLHDATLRDGEQTPGVVFRIEDKIAIARQIYNDGVLTYNNSVQTIPTNFVAAMTGSAICSSLRRDSSASGNSRSSRHPTSMLSSRVRGPA